MSNKEIVVNHIIQEINLIPEVYLINLFNIIRTFRENIPNKQEDTYKRNILSLYGSWKGEESSEELISLIYSGRINHASEVIL